MENKDNKKKPKHHGHISGALHIKKGLPKKSPQAKSVPPMGHLPPAQCTRTTPLSPRDNGNSKRKKQKMGVKRERREKENSRAIASPEESMKKSAATSGTTTATSHSEHCFLPSGDHPGAKAAPEAQGKQETESGPHRTSEPVRLGRGTNGYPWGACHSGSAEVTGHDCSIAFHSNHVGRHSLDVV